MKPVKRDTQEFKTLEDYVRDTHGATHEYLRVSVLNAYRVERFITFSGYVEYPGSHLIISTGPQNSRLGTEESLAI